MLRQAAHANRRLCLVMKAGKEHRVPLSDGARDDDLGKDERSVS
jgi:hypothetical protein